MSSSDCWFLNSALCGWKDQFGNYSPFRIMSRCQLLDYFSDFGSSSFGSLSQPVQQVSLQTRRRLALLLTFRLNVLKPRCPIRWCQCLRPSDPSCRHLYSVIGFCQWGAFLEPIVRKGDPLGSGRHPFSQHGQASANVSVVYTCWEFQVAAGLCCLELCLARWCWVCVADSACGKC